MAEKRGPGAVSLVRMNTADAIEAIAERLLGRIPNGESAAGGRVTFDLHQWTRQKLRPKWRRYHLAAELFGLFSDNERFASCANRALGLAKGRDVTGELLAGSSRGWSDLLQDRYAVGARLCRRLRVTHQKQRNRRGSAAWRAYLRVGPIELENTYLASEFLRAKKLGLQLHKSLKSVVSAARLEDRRFCLGLMSDIDCLLGNIYLTIGDPRGLEVYRRALATSRRIGNIDNEAYALGGCADGLRMAGRLVQSISLYKKAERLQRTLGNPWQVAVCSLGHADALRRVNRNEAGAVKSSVAKLRVALDELSRSGDALEWALGSRRLADALRAAAHGDGALQALRHYRAARRVLVEIGFQPGLLGVELSIADVERQRGRGLRAATMARSVERRASRLGLLLLSAHAHLEIGMALGNVVTLHRAEEAYRRLNCRWGIAEATRATRQVKKTGTIEPTMLDFVYFD